MEALVTEEEWRVQRRRRLGEVYRLLLDLETKTPDAIEAGQLGASGALDLAPERVTIGVR